MSQGIAQIIGDVSKVEEKICALLDSTFTSFFATPMAAPGVRLARLRAYLPAPQLLTAQAPYPPAHAFDTTSPSRLRRLFG